MCNMYTYNLCKIFFYRLEDVAPLMNVLHHFAEHVEDFEHFEDRLIWQETKDSGDWNYDYHKKCDCNDYDKEFIFVR